MKTSNELDPDWSCVLSLARKSASGACSYLTLMPVSDSKAGSCLISESANGWAENPMLIVVPVWECQLKVPLPPPVEPDDPLEHAAANTARVTGLSWAL